MRKIKDSGIEWIGQIPEEWNIYPTKRFFRHTKTLAGDQVDLYERLALTMNGVIKRSKNDSEGLQPERFDTYQVLRENELVFKLIDLANVKTSRVGLSPYTGIVSPAYIVLSNQNKDNRFFYYFFMSMYYNEIFNNLGDNGVRSSLNAQDLLNLPMVSVPAETQSRIADYLDEKCGEIDRYIEKQQQIIEKLKAYKQAVITEAVTKGLDPTIPMKYSGNEWIPEHWENRKVLSILAKRVIDGAHESPELFDEGVPYISATAIVNGKIDFSQKRGFISPEYCDICDQRYVPQVNDILMIKLGASTGQVAMVETTERFNIWVPIAAIRCNDSACPKFVYYAFQSNYFIKQMELSWTYGTQQTLGVKTIERLRLLMPNLEEQQRIADYLSIRCNLIDSSIEKAKQIVEKLTEYKKSLIYEAVTGKLEI